MQLKLFNPGTPHEEYLMTAYPDLAPEMERLRNLPVPASFTWTPEEE